ncbi:MAG: hypothetical protein RLZZ169_876 [Pseudomonadota bacterium]|jgi:hypothetical protein
MTGLTAMAPLPALAQWFLGSSAELRSNDNVTRSPVAENVEGDTTLLGSVEGGLHLQPGIYTGLTLSAGVTREQFRRFTGLSQTRGLLGATLDHKFGVGERAPRLRLGATIERADFNANTRNLWLHGIRLSYSQRLTDSLQFTAAIAHENQQGDNDRLRIAVPPARQLPGDTWNQEALVASTALEWATGPSSWLTATLQFRHGETAASITPRPTILRQATAVTNDPLFGVGKVAYRLDANTRQFALDWNLAVTEEATVYVGAERQLTRGGISLSYQVNVIRAGMVFSY